MSIFSIFCFNSSYSKDKFFVDKTKMIEDINKRMNKVDYVIASNISDAVKCNAHFTAIIGKYSRRLTYACAGTECLFLSYAKGSRKLRGYITF